MNALALVSEYGSPDFFITMACNPKWPELRGVLEPTEDDCNRVDLYARSFHARNLELKREIVTEKLLGEVAAYFYAIEFQKRGLPHVHWYVIMKSSDQSLSSDDHCMFSSEKLSYVTPYHFMLHNYYHDVTIQQNQNISYISEMKLLFTKHIGVYLIPEVLIPTWDLILHLIHMHTNLILYIGQLLYITQNLYMICNDELRERTRIQPADLLSML